MATRLGSHRTKTATRSHRSRSNGARLRKQAMQIGDELHTMGSIARDSAQEKVDDLRDTASEYYEMSREKVQEMERTFETYVRNQPVKSILIAASVGLLVGRFIMRR